MSQHFEILHKVSLVTAILPPSSVKPVIERLFAAGERNAFVTNARGTLIRQQWLQRFLPLISPEKEILQFLVPDAQVDSVIRDIADQAGLRYPGSGAVYSVPCDDVIHTPDFPIWEGLEAGETGDDASIGLRENLAAIACILQPEHTDTVARAAMRAGAHGPVVYYCEGRGLRDRLGWLRITKKRTKEVMLVIVDNADADAVVQAMTEAGRLTMPGRGYLFRMPVQKGIVSLATTVGHPHHAADMQQVIAALDELLGHSDWRRRQVVRLGTGAHAAGVDLDAAEVTQGAEPHTRVTVISSGQHMQPLLDAAVAAGATGANVLSARFVEAESKVAMGRRLNRERSWVQTVVPTPIAQSVIGAVVACAEAENITEVCVFGQPVTGVVTYQAQTVEAPQSPVRTYRGAPLES